MEIFVEKRSVAYHEDVAGLFATLGGVTATDSVLLESSDIDSKKKTLCIGILDGAARVTCVGQQVYVEPLTTAGELIAQRIAEQLAEYLVEQRKDRTVVFAFPPADELDERKRLQAPNPSWVLRALQLEAGYQGEFLPFLGGAFASDYIETFEHFASVPPGSNSYPDYQFLLAQTYLRVDHLSEQAVIEAIGVDKEQLHAHLDQLAQLIDDFHSDYAPLAHTEEKAYAYAETTDDEFCAQVLKLQENIRQGDIYQVVPARTFRMDCPDAFAAYRTLRETSPSPYMFYVRGHVPAEFGEHILGSTTAQDFELFGASPETNLAFDAHTRQVELYPVAGSIPRGLNPDGTVNHELDIRAELEMRSNAKEIAEHIMLIDLARNDLARIAQPATRKVAEFMKVDRYSRIMHLVSRVVATLDTDLDALDAYRACMNMGTLTGAPKLRAIELIREVEGTRRGSYGGAVGYLSGNGSMDTCIVIRSAFVRGGTAFVQAGAGVVRDSVPIKEAYESYHKAYATLSAIAQAQGKKIEVITHD
ncbi:anthranilate synthase component 1 [Corynebacterium sp. sy039]|uniref:anthranilate synthase component 1 n=1 Tax=Corynebacterium sp. sy039 TaxID=2599641 RepID=UPI0011B40CBF|nr:anthranilate synthase component 1 [Corynebacterium sp. sy039]QDZ43426.1 anthranilate synthase component 1 [Corynebacterium sp. sy039]